VPVDDPGGGDEHVEPTVAVERIRDGALGGAGLGHVHLLAVDLEDGVAVGAQA
jgi:hypothetical protein